MTRSRFFFAGVLGLAALGLVVLLFQRWLEGPVAQLPPLMDDGAGWFSYETPACLIFDRGSAVVQQKLPFGPFVRYPVEITSDRFLFRQTGQAQRYRRFTEPDPYRPNLLRSFLTVEGNGPIPPGKYEWAHYPHCQEPVLQ